MSVQPCEPPDALVLTHEAPEHAAQIEALLDHAFGPGRFAKSSERVREFAEFAPELSFCAWRGERLAGAVRMWRVAVGGRPLLFLGPLAVDREQRSAGLGGLLVARACKAAKAAGETAILLVGDEPYFGRFGFHAAPAAHILMPGPVDQDRVLVLRFEDAEFEGPVTSRGAA